MAELSSALTDTATPNVIYRGVHTLISYICNKDHNCHVIMAYAITKVVLLPADFMSPYIFSTPNTFCAKFNLLTPDQFSKELCFDLSYVSVHVLTKSANYILRMYVYYDLKLSCLCTLHKFNCSLIQIYVHSTWPWKKKDVIEFRCQTASVSIPRSNEVHFFLINACTPITTILI